MSHVYAPDYAELVEQARCKPLTVTERETALNAIADRQDELQREQLKLAAFRAGHEQALIEDRTFTAMVNDVMALLDKWGYQPKSRCTVCEPNWLDDALNGRR